MIYIADRITVDERICNGKPTIRGLAITVKTILEFLFAGETREEILYQYPDLTNADIDACLQFALAMTDHKHMVYPLAA
jgi:uncharacterized protein (DUF433 family)